MNLCIYKNPKFSTTTNLNFHVSKLVNLELVYLKGLSVIINDMHSFLSLFNPLKNYATRFN